MAQLKQCVNGHYYDLSMYSTCPYCSGVSVGIDRSVSNYNIPTTGPKTEGSSTPASGTVSPIAQMSTMDVTHESETNGPTKAPKKPIEDTGVTTPLGHWRKKGENKPEQDFPDEEDELPQRYVVGWLVAVKGKYIGKSFELHQSYNHVGREKGDIILKKESTVSAEKHVSILYTKYNNFLIGAGQSTNEVYLNEEVLFSGSSKELKPYDLIEIGDSKFRFVPFCSEQFQW